MLIDDISSGCLIIDILNTEYATKIGNNFIFTSLVDNMPFHFVNDITMTFEYINLNYNVVDILELRFFENDDKKWYCFEISSINGDKTILEDELIGVIQQRIRDNKIESILD